MICVCDTWNFLEVQTLGLLLSAYVSDSLGVAWSQRGVLESLHDFGVHYSVQLCLVLLACWLGASETSLQFVAGNQGLLISLTG